MSLATTQETSGHIVVKTHTTYMAEPRTLRGSFVLCEKYHFSPN